MPHHLVPLARITAPHVALDSYRQPGPLEVLCHQCLRARHPVVSRQRGVMVLLENAQNQGCRRGRDEDAVLMVQDAELNTEQILRPARWPAIW